MVKFVAILLLGFTSLSGCAVYTAWDACETARKGELRFKFPEDAISREIKVTHEITPEERCYPLSNYGEYTDHNAWAECMGVPYR